MGLFTLSLKEKFNRDIFTLAGGTALGQLLVLFASPFLARLYTPADFGLLGVYVASLAILLVFSSLRYELAVPIARRDFAAVNLVVLCFIIVFLYAALVGGFLCLWGDTLAAGMHAPALSSYAWLLSFSLVAAGSYKVLNFWAIRRQAFSSIAKTKVSQGVGQVATQLLLGWWSAGPVGLICGDVVGRFSGALAFLPSLKELREKVKVQVSRRGLLAAAWRFRRFPLIASGSGLLNTLGLNLPVLLFTALYGPQVAGWFSFSQRIVSVPITLLGNAVAQAYLSEASGLLHRNPHELRRLYWRTAGKLLCCGAVPIVLISLLSHWWFPWIFGDNWLNAGRFVRLLACAFGIQFIVFPLSQTLNVLERQDLQLLWDAGRLLAVLACFAAGYFFRWRPFTTVLCYGIVISLSYMLHVLIAHRAILFFEKSH